MLALGNLFSPNLLKGQNNDQKLLKNLGTNPNGGALEALHHIP